MGVNTVLLVAFVLDFGFGVYVFAKAFVIDWKVDLQTIDKMTEKKKPKADILKPLSEFIRAHSNVKQLSIHFRLNFTRPYHNASINK